MFGPSIYYGNVAAGSSCVSMMKRDMGPFSNSNGKLWWVFQICSAALICLSLRKQFEFIHRSHRSVDAACYIYHSAPAVPSLLECLCRGFYPPTAPTESS